MNLGVKGERSLPSSEKVGCMSRDERAAVLHVKAMFPPRVLLALRDYFARTLDLSKPDTLQRQWGGTIGGPVVRDKVHFFGSLERIEARQLRRAVLVNQTTQHVRLTVYSTLIVLALAIPLGILATRPGTRRLAPAVIGLGNAGQAIPSLGLLALIFFVARQTPMLPSTGMSTPSVTACPS